MKRIMMIIMAVALVALPTMAQFGNEDKNATLKSPNAGFQSTSTMQGSGSAYSANPMLNADGTAFNPTEASSPRTGMHRAKQEEPGTPGSGGTQQPIGDAVLPLMLMAFAFGGVIYLRRRKAVNR